MSDTHTEAPAEAVAVREIVAIRLAPCPVASGEHACAVKLRDGTVEFAADVIIAIVRHEAHYVMIPPPGAPAYEAHAQTGLALEVQVKPCPDCGKPVLFA